jgi:hypothetical protein
MDARCGVVEGGVRGGWLKQGWGAGPDGFLWPHLSGVVHLRIPEHLRVANCRCFTGAMGLGLRPQRQRVEVNPESPNIPMGVVMGCGGVAGA